jgi:glutaredoxin
MEDKCMYQVIGKKNCSQCTLVKDMLTNRGIPFEYLLLDEMPSAEQSKYIAMAELAGQRNYPLIVKDGSLILLKEVA